MKLMAHQEEALTFLSDKRTGGILFEQGLGKTFTMLEHLNRLAAHGHQPFPCLIVAPLSVVPVWEAEIKKFGYDFSVKQVTGNRIKRLAALSETHHVYVTNYEGMRIYEKELGAKHFRTIVLDESHRIKNKSSKQTESAMRLGASAFFKFILTGTPVTKSPEDVWSQMEFISPGFFGNWWAFRNKYIQFIKISVPTRDGYREIEKAFKFKNLKQMEELIGLKCIRRTKAECLDLPEKVYKVVPCFLEGEQKRAYHAAKTDLCALIGDKIVDLQQVKGRVQKMQQICQGFIYPKDYVDGSKDYIAFENSAKLSALEDILEDIITDITFDESAAEKAIVFTYYKADLAIVRARLLKLGYQVYLYEGSSEDRASIVESFQQHKGGCIFLANIDQAKEGITLTAANHVIYYGNSYSYGTRAQSEDRAHRVGQKKTVVYYDIVCAGTVDALITRILTTKQKTADAITGDSERLARMIAGIDEEGQEYGTEREPTIGV